jgi:ferredoxin--NADP+ reductase
MPGDEVKLAGPYGRQFLAPKDPSANMLMIGVGTGIAPFRAFMKHLYSERGDWKGKVRLFYGATSGMEMLYLNDENGDLANYYDEETFEAFRAISPRPHFEEPADMAKTVEDNANEVWDLIQDENTYVYVAGQTSLEQELDEVLSRLAGSSEAWAVKKQQLIEEHRWATLFYA